MDVTPKVSIVVPTLDGGRMLASCLEQLDAARPELDVVIVDNASTDGSVEAAQKLFPSIRVIRNDTNRGYAPACNMGARAARAEFILFLNNDAKLEPAQLDRILEVARAEAHTAVWQPVTYGVDGTLESTGDLFTWWGIFSHLADVPPGRPSAEVFSTVGAALLVRRAAFEGIGGFHDSYFAYYEESDLCWRMRLAGWQVRVVTDARVEHVGSETTGRIFEPHAVRYLAFRNRVRTVLANAGPGSLARLVPQHLAACIAFVILYLATGRWRSAKAVAAAVVWPIGHLDLVREQRAQVQSSRALPDRDVLRRDLVGTFGPRALWRHLRRAYWFERASERGLVSDNTRRN